MSVTCSKNFRSGATKHLFGSFHGLIGNRYESLRPSQAKTGFKTGVTVSIAGRPTDQMIGGSILWLDPRLLQSACYTGFSDCTPQGCTISV